MQAPETQGETQHLSTLGPLKTWSLVVTILGDLCLDQQDRLPGRVLHLLTGRMGVTDQSVRVALHRLRRSGWIVSDKQGRVSHYGLSPMGWSETQAVWGTIYDQTAPAAETVQMVVTHSNSTDLAALLPEDALIIAPRTALVAGSSGTLPDDCLTTPVSISRLPDWTVTLIADPELRDDYSNLTGAVSALDRDGARALIDRTVLRLLILHHWRRLRLRHGPLPDALLGDSWEGASARSAVFRALSALPRPPLSELVLQDT